jgi:hypothetical protein
VKIGDYEVKVHSRNGILVGCTYVSRDDVLAVLKLMDACKKKAKFSIGDTVKVTGKRGDDAQVTGRIGTVVGFDAENVLVKFRNWDYGDGSSSSQWFVTPRGLKKVKV